MEGLHGYGVAAIIGASGMEVPSNEPHVMRERFGKSMALVRGLARFGREISEKGGMPACFVGKPVCVQMLRVQQCKRLRHIGEEAGR